MEFLIILGLILLNGIFSMSEIAVVSARKSRLEIDANKGSSGARTALKLAENPDRFLSTIQIGITLIGILTGLFSGDMLAVYVTDWIERIGILAPYAPAIAKGLIVVVVTYLTLILGELVPKRIGLGASGTVSKIVSRPWISYPNWPCRSCGFCPKALKWWSGSSVLTVRSRIL